MERMDPISWDLQIQTFVGVEIQGVPRVKRTKCDHYRAGIGFPIPWVRPGADNIDKDRLTMREDNRTRVNIMMLR